MKRMVTDMKHGMMMRMNTKMINAADKEKIRKGKELLDNHLYDEAREILEEYAYSFGPCAFWLGCMSSPRVLKRMMCKLSIGIRRQLILVR